MHPLISKLPWLVGLVLIALLALLISLLIGSIAIPLPEIGRVLLHDDGSLNARIIHELRLPRTLSAFAVGGTLGLAGALMQVLLRNPLGDPYILGVSGGAAVAVLFSMLLGIPLIWHAPAAFVGALLSMLMVFFLAHRGNWNSSRLLLTGIVIAAGWSAIISFVLSLSPPVQLPGMLFWLMGDLGSALSPAMPLMVLLIGLAISLWIAPDLNILAHGGLRAAALGINTKRLHMIIYLLSSLLTAAAVSIAGAIGFIGLVAPHMIRLLVGSDHRLLLPASSLAGGSLLVLADTAARSIISPMQLPVGVLTAIIGVPIFLLLLHLNYKQQA